MNYNNEEFQTGNYKDLITIFCDTCGCGFKRKYSFVKYTLIHKPESKSFCSILCRSKFQTKQRENISCKNCGVDFITVNVKNVLSRKFCSKSCSATYNNCNKKSGCRRSKLEKWIENKLKETYPHLDIIYNDKETINSELDIFIPSLRLAFELNGIFHYEPIYGIRQLSKIQNNDNRKFQACLEHLIELCIIDTSKQIYFTEKSSQQFLQIICWVIDQKQFIK